MIAPEITAKLMAFARRRQKLILQRGLCETAVVLVLGLGLCAAADWLFLLDDPVRYVMSAAAWLGGAYTLWRTCLRPMQHSTDPVKLARLIEAARPELREELVSAVELGHEDGRARWDSAVFRELLQQDVARRVNPLEIESLLPKSLVKKWLRAAGAMALVLLVLLLVPGLHFGTLLLRALNPTANIDRVSKVKIAVVEPESGGGKVAANDQVSVVVDIAGAEAPEVFLDTYRNDGGGGRTKMLRVGKNRYAAEIAMRTAAVKYRVRAGDGVTKKYKLMPFPRPQAVAFAKTYHYPEYARRGDTNVVEPHGDLDALQGSTVKVEITTDQPVSEGQLNFDIGDRTSSVALVRSGPKTLAATVPMKQSGLYKVRLVGEDTGFENKFSPVYEIRVQNDLLPTITLDEPARDQVVMPDETLSLMGAARDDVGIERVDQYIQINDGPWRPVPLATNFPDREASIAKNWELFPMGVRPGDRITTKLVATDWKGNKGESTTLRLLVGNSGAADAEDRRRVEVQRKVQASLDKLQQKAKEVAKAAEEAAKEMNKPQPEATPPKEAATKLADAAAKAAETAQEAQEQIKEALREIPDGRDAEDLVRLGRMVSKLQRESFEAAAERLNRASQAPQGDDAKTPVSHALNKLREAVWPAEDIERKHERLLAAQEADIAASDLQQLAKEQDRIEESAQKIGDDPEKRALVEQRQEQAEQQVSAVQDRLRTMFEEAPSARGWEAKDIAGRMDSAMREGHRIMAKKEDEKYLQQGLDKISDGLNRARDEARNLASNLAREADEARRELARQATDSAEQVERAHQVVREAQHDNRPADHPERRERVAKAADALQTAAAELRDRAALEELRNDADPAFQRDLAQTAAALDALQDRGEAKSQDTTRSPVQDLAKALATLETGHQVGETAADLADLAAQERFQKPDARDTAEQAREFKGVAEQQREDTQNDLNRINAPEPAKQAFAQAFNSQEAQQARQEMDRRANDGQKNAPVAKPLAKMANDVAKARQELQPAMEDARDMIASLAPSLAERMKALANTEKRMQEKTAETAQQTQPSREEAAGHLAKQQDFNQRLDDLKDALRYDAAAQDLGAQEGRERARDADDALAMIRPPEQAAEQHLQNAAAVPEAAQRANELNAAQAEQGNLANALDQLAQHYENLEAGHPEDTRAALRGAESEEMKAALDQQYNRAAEIAALQEQAPQDALAALQQQLQSDPVMRTELAAIAQDNLQRAAESLANAVAREQQIGKSLEQLAQTPPPNLRDQLQGQANQQQQVQGSTDEAGQDIEVAGQEQAALGMAQGEALQQVGEQTQATAGNQMNNAAQQLGQAQQAQAAAPSVQAAQGAAQQNLNDLNALRAQSPAAPHQAAETPAQAASQWMARALDDILQGQQTHAEAMAQAQQQTERQLQLAREENRQFGIVARPGSAIVIAAAQPETDVTGVAAKNGDWGNLPKRMAQELMNAEHEGVSEEYRGQVEAYFKAVTAKAKAKK